MIKKAVLSLCWWFEEFRSPKKIQTRNTPKAKLSHFQKSRCARNCAAQSNLALNTTAEIEKSLIPYGVTDVSFWKSYFPCSKRTENIINGKIRIFYIEAIPKKYLNSEKNENFTNFENPNFQIFGGENFWVKFFLADFDGFSRGGFFGSKNFQKMKIQKTFFFSAAKK